jgi:ABC-type Mn2+/Zn2+ transport system permease subunit/Mn-dependent DtxR family transcriptional regulator
MERIFEVLQYDYAQRALLASGLVGVLCGILGCFIILRHMALIGDALSHAILPGVVAGFLVAGHSILAFFVGSVVAGIIAAVLITWLQRNVKTKDDAAIGIVFSAMFALGIMGISWLTRREGVHLDMKDFLFGNVLGIANQDLWLTALITAYTILCVAVFYRYFFITTFQPVVAQTLGISSRTIHYFLMLLLSFAVVASLQSVGVILVVAMLIIPASTAFLLTNRLRPMLVIAAALGVIATTSGLLIAIMLETTPGPAMTLTAAALYGLTIAFAPQRGMVVNAIRRSRRQKTVRDEDVLKGVARLHEQRNLTHETLATALRISGKELDGSLHRLSRGGSLVHSAAEIGLTSQGLDRAYQLIRAHRLWESFLAREMKLTREQVHAQAEQLEHNLPESFLKEIEEHLEHPRFDPHGSPIPQRPQEDTALSSLEVGARGIITTDQPHKDVAVELWKNGLTPNTPFRILDKTEHEIEVDTSSARMKLPVSLAAAVRVTPLNGKP